jgi:hypothetical protein
VPNYFLLRRSELAVDEVGRAKIQAGMRIAVVADFVPGRRNLLGDGSQPFDVLTAHEEGGGYVVTVENPQQRGSRFAGSVVEGERNRGARAIAMIHRGPKNSGSASAHSIGHEASRRKQTDRPTD